MKKKMGRPPVSKYVYKPEYCTKLIEMSRTGGTIAMFCADIGVYKEIFYQWAEKYEEFSDAKKEALTLWEAHSDRLGLAAQTGKLKGFALGVWIWNRKNKLKERDQVSIEQTNSYEPVVIELGNGSKIQLGMERKLADNKTTQISDESVGIDSKSN